MKKEVIPKKTLRVELINSVDAEQLRVKNPKDYNRVYKFIQDTIKKEYGEQ